MIPLAASFMAPSVYDEKNKDDETENQQDYGPRFIIPELLNAPGDVFEIHARLIYTRVGKSEITQEAACCNLAATATAERVEK